VSFSIHRPSSASSAVSAVCGQFLHELERLKDPKYPDGKVCTRCGEIFPYVFEIRLRNDPTIQRSNDQE